MSNQLELDLKVTYLRDLWKEFCEKHTLLYETTCDEYMHLLSSEMDLLEESVNNKEIIIAEINALDDHRQNLIQEIAGLLESDVPEKIADVFSHERVDPKIAAEIEKYNLILLDIVEKIMEQNKKNQFFLNKALHSLKELKDNFTGQTNYSTYSSKGVKKSAQTY